MVFKIKEQIKTKKSLLQALEIQIQGSPYNRNQHEVERKKEQLRKEVLELEKKLAYFTSC